MPISQNTSECNVCAAQSKYEFCDRQLLLRLVVGLFCKCNSSLPCKMTVAAVVTCSGLPADMPTGRGSLRDSQLCRHTDDVRAVKVILADQVRHFLQILRRQLVAPLQSAQKTCVVNPHTAYTTQTSL